MDDLGPYITTYALDRLLSPDLLSKLQPRHCPAGDLLLRSGEALDYLYFFVEGRAKVLSHLENGSTLLVRFYRPFDILGDVELFGNRTCFLDVEAIEDCLCLALPSKALDAALDRNAPLLSYLCGRLGAKLTESNSAAAINLRYPVEERLASYLLAYEGLRSQGLGADSLGEVADLLGASYRQLSRVIRRFRSQGLLEGGRGLRIKDRPGLELLARDLFL